MADNDEVNDEYQFTELDPLSPPVTEEEQSSPDEKGEAGQKKSVGGSANNVKRNAMIAVIAFIGFMLVYKFVGTYLTGTKNTVSEIKPAMTTAPNPAAVEPSPEAEPTPSVPVVSVPEPNAEIKSNLSSLTIGQENLNSQISTLSGQVGNLNSNLDSLAAKISELNRVITSLSEKLDNQSQTIERLSAKPVVKVVRHPERRDRRVIRYYIQAVIPGRAWIASEDGSTLTVREGSRVPGYGQVRLIDPNQGRVMTSSGLVIRFSQSDS